VDCSAAAIIMGLLSLRHSWRVSGFVFLLEENNYQSIFELPALLQACSSVRNELMY